MATRERSRAASLRAAQALALALVAAFAPQAARAADAPAGWEVCEKTAERGARLDCFDDWTRRMREAAAPARTIEQPGAQPPVLLDRKEPDKLLAKQDDTPDDDCHRRGPSALTRFWELEERSSCGTFGIRGYRPISLSAVVADGVNREPTSGNPLNNASTEQAYRTQEMRIQLSVRTKLLEGWLATSGEARDSLWFGYTQQSYWQVFTPSLSRPFRSTDHEPEFVYIYPFQRDLKAGWQLRYTGLGVVHQSNGQSLPYSRSWNRIYVLAGAEHEKLGLTLQGRVWQRIPESAATDDNPDISDYIGRAEVTGTWDPANSPHSFAVTLRHSLRSLGKGSVRIGWMRRLEGKTASALGTLRLHTQLFSGYGDSLIDFNRRRTMLSVGLSLVDW